MKFQRQYFYNDDYFKVIDTEEKAYWVGFLYGDGHVSDHDVSITLQDQDKEHLVKFLKAIDANTVPIKNKPEYNTCYIGLYSSKFIKNLQNLGFVHNKTYEKSDLVFKNIPDKYRRDFLRGYWDADGLVGSYSKQQCLALLVSLNEVMLESIKNYLNQHFNDEYFCKLEPSSSSNCMIIRVGSDKAIKLCTYLYKDSTIYLDRKYEHFLQFRPLTKNYYNIRKRPSGNYGVYIKVNRKQISLGTYKTIKEAVEAYNKAAEKYGRIPQPYVGESLYIEQKEKE